MAPEVVVLLSLGRHPVSLRPRVPDQEARAIALAARSGGSVTALHAGAAAAEAALRDALGLGAQRLVLLETAPSDDPLPNLLAWLGAHGGDVILAGERAETGEGSGMTAFVVAEALGRPLVARAVAMDCLADRARLHQALPAGRRRVLEAALPVVATVGAAAPPAPLVAIGPALRGSVSRQAGAAATPDRFHQFARQPSRKRPRRLAAFGAEVGHHEPRRELVAADPVSAADAILDFLEREAVIPPAVPAGSA